MNPLEIVKLIVEGTSFVAQAIGAFVGGDDSEPVRRVIEVLPGALRSRLELARQRELTRQALEAELGKRDTEPPVDA